MSSTSLVILLTGAQVSVFPVKGEVEGGITTGQATDEFATEGESRALGAEVGTGTPKAGVAAASDVMRKTAAEAGGAVAAEVGVETGTGTGAELGKKFIDFFHVSANVDHFKATKVFSQEKKRK